MTTNYNVDKTKLGVNGFGAQFSDTKYSATLKAATEATVTVPATAAIGAPTATTYNKFLAVISCSAVNVWMALNATAAVPAGNTLVATTSELVPGYIAKQVKSGDVLHFISASTPDLSVVFYAIQE